MSSAECEWLAALAALANSAAHEHCAGQYLIL